MAKQSLPPHISTWRRDSFGGLNEIKQKYHLQMYSVEPGIVWSAGKQEL